MSVTSEFAKAMDQQLASIGHNQATREAPLTLTIQAGAQTADITFTAVDQLACAVRTVSVPASFARNGGQLKQLGGLLADRLQYLVEPIATIELDEEKKTLQMRSLPPTEHGDHIRSYYELVGEHDRVVLKRYTVRGKQPRSRIDMHFTREILPRLVTDLCQAIREVNPG